MSNKQERETKEGRNLFEDPKFARQAWKTAGIAILKNPATKPKTVCNKDGVETIDSVIENYAYDALSRDMANIAKENREPTQLEMIMMTQAIRARTDVAAAVFIRDTVGAKPIDESKVDTTVNQYEKMTDEELELLAKYREEKAATEEKQ